MQEIPVKTSLTLGGIILGLTAAVTLMLLSFLAPMMNSGPDDIPVAVSAPAPVVSALSENVAVTTYDDPSAARDAVLERDAVGAVTVDADGATVYTASGAGQPYTQVLTGIAAGMDATVEDLAPTTEDDPTAGGLSALALPLAFGGMVSAAVLSMAMKRRYLHRVLGAALSSVLRCSPWQPAWLSGPSSSSVSAPSTGTTGRRRVSWHWASRARRCSSSDWRRWSGCPAWRSAPC
jgi:hypothetical protein